MRHGNSDVFEDIERKVRALEKFEERQKFSEPVREPLGCKAGRHYGIMYKFCLCTREVSIASFPLVTLYEARRDPNKVCPIICAEVTDFPRRLFRDALEVLPSRATGEMIFFTFGFLGCFWCPLQTQRTRTFSKEKR